MSLPLTLAAALACLAAPLAAQDPVTRAELSRTDLEGDPAREVIIADLSIAPGAYVPKHTRPGSERLVVIEGDLVTLPNGASAEFAPGMIQHFERGMVHAGITNSGDTPIRLITVHIVEKGQPQNVPVE
jgi:quercetin dioxygenase-like cupin family protein